MEKEFIPFELAVKLKELGMSDDNVMFHYHRNNGEIYHNLDWDLHYNWADAEIAPLWQQAFDWFLEKHDLYHQILKGYGWEGIIRAENANDIKWHDGTYNDYYEVRTACLEKLIEIVEKQQA